MNRIDLIPQYDDFFKALKETLNNYAISINKTTNTFFAEKLFITRGKKSIAFANLLNPNTSKDLKVRELLLLLDNCPEHQKPLLDWLCVRYDLVCSSNADIDSDIENLQESINNLPIEIGNLFNEYIISKSDNKIDASEKEKMKAITYSLRQKLVSIENIIDAIEVE